MKSEAELTLVIKARDLSGAVMGRLKSDLEQVRTAASKIGAAFRAGLPIAQQAFGRFVDDIANNKDLSKAATDAGILAAGLFVEAYGAQLIEKLLASSFVQGIAATLAALGATMGEIIGAALAAATVLWPALLIAALIAIVAVLITNPEIRDKVFELGGKILGAIVDGLAAAQHLIVSWMNDVVQFLFKLPQMLFDLGPRIVGAIVDGLVGLGKKVMAVVRLAFEQLKIDVGPFHISGKTGITVDLPNFGPDAAHQGMTYAQAHGLTQHAAGGWAGLNGPELSMLGEKGPEFVLSNAMLQNLSRSSGTYVAVPVSQRELVDMVDRGMYFKLQRAAPSRDNA